MTRRCQLLLTLTAAIACGCGSPPPPPPPPPPPAPAPIVQPPVRQETTATAFSTRLPNGLALSVTQAQVGEQAQLHLGFLVGSLFVAPGLAELAAEAVVQGADASRGRPSLAQAIAGLGGIVRVVVGPLTTWIEMRVPASRQLPAQAALLRALEAPPLPRSQLERIRDEVVKARCSAIQQDPAQAMALALLLAEPDTTSYVSSLLDRDASEIGLFQARLLRPERALFALHCPGVPAAIGNEITSGNGETLRAWQPATLSAPEPRILQRTFQSGFYWSPDGKTDTCEVAWLQFLPSLAQSDAADLLVLHACCTLDGAGGRLEQLQRERGLGSVRWRSEFVHSADTAALLLRTTVPSADVVRVQQVLQAARNSLRDVPPTTSELELARRRAALTAGLGQSDSLARQRTNVSLAAVGATTARFERRLAQLAQPGALDVASAAAAYLALPSMCIAIGGTIPPETPGVRRFTLLPPGLAPAQATDPVQQSVAATPWIERASEAIGGERLLRRFIGYQFEGRVQSQQAPPAIDKVTWQVAGSLRRTRSLLGKEIETRLEGNSWSEQLGDTKQSLTAREAALLLREMERQPLALLAACSSGKLTFHAIAQRNVGDRDYMVLEAASERFDRLRIHIDTISHLVRVVEVWETMPDGTTVHLQDNWSDYRTADGLRAPFRRVTTQDDGQNSVETLFTSWRPLLSAP